MGDVNRFWEDAARILEMASAAPDPDCSDIVILVDEQNGLRIVHALGRGLDALRREYQASTAYAVKRTAGCVTVEAQNGSEQCTLKKTLAGNPLTNFAGGIPHHLIRPERLLK